MAVRRIEPGVGDKTLFTTIQKNNKDLDLKFYARRGTMFEDGRRRGDIYKKEDLKAIDQSINTILTTNHYEKPFQPKFGANLRRLLFELNTMIAPIEVEDIIRKEIQLYEPRVEVLEIEIYDLGASKPVPRGISNVFYYSTNSDTSRYSLVITVYCKIKATGQTISTKVNMNRLR